MKVATGSQGVVGNLGSLEVRGWGWGAALERFGNDGHVAVAGTTGVAGWRRKISQRVAGTPPG